MVRSSAGIEFHDAGPDEEKCRQWMLEVTDGEKSHLTTSSACQVIKADSVWTISQQTTESQTCKLNDKFNNEVHTETSVVLKISDGGSIPACRHRWCDWSTQPGLQCRQQQWANAV